MNLDELRYKLKLYGQWSNHNAIYIGLPNQTPFRRMQGSSISAQGMGDDEAMEYNSLMCELKQHDANIFSAVKTYSIYCKPLPRKKWYVTKEAVSSGLHYLLGRIAKRDNAPPPETPPAIKTRAVKAIGRKVINGGITGCAVYETKLIKLL